jgi:carboxyl-terminal processing protease
MGTRSFGKGSVQTVIPITEDRAIKLTTALYYTPNGRSIQARGIDPDVRLERSSGNLGEKTVVSEADLAGHINHKEGGEVGGKREREAAISDDILKDNQVLDAVNLLKGMHILGQQPGAPGNTPNTDPKAQDKSR